MKTHGDAAWQSFPSYHNLLVPAHARHDGRTGPAHHLLHRRARRGDPSARRGLLRDRATRPRGRQSFVSPRALDAPALRSGDRRRTRRGRGADRTRDRGAPQRVPRTWIHSLVVYPGDAGSPWLSLRRVVAADVHRPACARLLLPQRQAQPAGDGRARGPVRTISRMDSAPTGSTASASRTGRSPRFP